MDDDDASAPLRGGPIGRRIFLGLVGIGAAGLFATRSLLREDDSASLENLGVAVPMGPDGQPPQQEDILGYHPNRVWDERFRYYAVGDIPDFDERTWRLTVDGEGADNPLKLRYADVKAFPRFALTNSTFHCVTGWQVRGNTWVGVRLRDILAAASPNGRAKFVTLYANDGAYTESLVYSPAEAQSSRALLVWELGGQPLIREQGFPLRLVFPDMYGYKSIKWLARIELKGTRDLGYWEQTDDWDIEAWVYGGGPPPGAGG
ncbi:MAG TPA: molybdopterin-dependent oxidoreductase [Candidatus Dormibacteraeota bacterium]|nr:molybdopterin-dependent oxidoreductase [Candidatus Dormibacteraeota bacterium]